MSTAIRRSDPPPVNGSKNGAATKARADAVALLRQPKPPTRRRVSRAAVGIAAALLGCWAFASMYLSAGHRTNALVLDRTVPRFETIKRDDLNGEDRIRHRGRPHRSVEDERDHRSDRC